MIYGDIFRQKLQLVNTHIVADTIDYLEMKFCFRTDDWNGLEKWAHFRNGDISYDILLTNDCIRKEDHLNLYAGEWKVYLHGNKFRDGMVTERITTETAFLKVESTGTWDGKAFPETPVSVTERILARLTLLESHGNPESSETVIWKAATLEDLKLMLTAGLTPITLAPDADVTVTETLNLPAGTVIHGNGATIRRAAGFEGILFFLKAGCRLENFTIEGNRTAMVSPTWDKTIEISTRANCVIDGITINDANEAIVVYEDDVLVRGCRLYNCGGNGIHFSGADRTRVEDCVIIGANKKASQMGHSEGCIIWSDKCCDTVVENCWCEDGAAGFGAIDHALNSNIKLLGNTVKNCTNAVYGRFTASAPHDIQILGNHFIDSGRLRVAVNGTYPYTEKFAIANNIFDGTGIQIGGFRGVVVSGNTVRGDILELDYCPYSVIADNIVENPAGIGIYIDHSPKTNVTANNVRCLMYGVYMGYSNGVMVANNTIRQNPNTSNNFCIQNNYCEEAAIINNRLYIYAGNGILCGSNSQAVGNVIVTADAALTAIRVWGGNSGYIVSNNMSNGKFNVSTATGAVVENNIAIASTAFVEVTFTLTNITSDGFAKALTDDDYTCTLTAADGYSLPETITVTMDGTTLASGTGYAYDKASGGKVTVYRVSGAVEITAGA